MGLHFNPADIQSVGIGLAAFLSTLCALFVILSARHEKLGRAMIPVFVASSVWAWFGFLYHLVGNLDLARDFRVVSVIGIVWLCITHVYFSKVYFEERLSPGRWVRAAKLFVFSIGGILTLLLLSDLLGTHFIVGSLDQPTDMVLAPHGGPLMAIVIVFYVISVAISGILLALRARHAVDQAERRQVEWVFWSFVIGLFLGGTRFTPWYGFDYYPLVGDTGYPLVIFALFYAMKRYRLLNLQMAAAQLLIFALWTSTFFRLLLDTSLRAAIPDLLLFLAVLVLGVLLMRSIIKEARVQRELAAVAVERTKSEFITVAAHQLRTPVAALRWSFNLLAEGGAQLSEKQRALVDKGNRAADNMMHLVNDLLDMGHIAEGRFTYTFAEGNPGDTIRAEAGLFEDVAKQKGVTLDVRIADNLPAIWFDANRLNIAIQNLIDNAVKYTAAGGRVTIAAERFGEGVRITVQDTGIGFTPDEQSRVFEKFFRGSRAVHMSPDGSGLGLFIAKTVVEGHGGTLAFSTEEGKGARFIITLPAKPPANP